MKKEALFIASIFFVLILLSYSAQAFSFKDMFKNKDKEKVDSLENLTKSLINQINEMNTKILGLEERVSQLNNIFAIQNEAIAGLNQKITILNNTCTCQNQQSNGAPTQPPNESIVVKATCENTIYTIIRSAGYTCLRSSTGPMIVELSGSRQVQVKPIGIKFVVISGGNTTTTIVRGNEVPGKDQENVYTLYGDGSTIQSASYASIVEENGTEKICGAIGIALNPPCM